MIDNEEYEAELPDAELHDLDDDDDDDDVDLSDTDYAHLIDDGGKDEQTNEETGPPSPKKHFAVREQSEMFQLRSFLSKIDMDYFKSQNAVQQRRDELACCRDRQEFLERERNKTLKNLEKNKSNIAAKSRLEDELKRILQELTSESELESQIRNQLKQAEYDFAIADVQQGRMKVVDGELRQLERSYTSVQQEEADIRLKRENRMLSMVETGKELRLKRKEKTVQWATEETKRRQKATDEAYHRAIKAKAGLDEKIARQRELSFLNQKEQLQRHTGAIVELKENIKKNREGLSAAQARRKANQEIAEAEIKVLKEEFRRQGLHPDQQLLVRKRMKALQDAKADLAVKSHVREVEIAEKLLKEESSLQRRKERQPYLFKPLRDDVVPEQNTLKPLKLVSQMVAGLDLQTARPVFETQRTRVISRELRPRSLSARKKAEDNDELILADEADDSNLQSETDSIYGDQRHIAFKSGARRTQQHQANDEDEQELAVPEFQGLWLNDKASQMPKTADGEVPNTKNRLKAIKRSKLEEEMFKKSLDRLRAGAVRKQIVAGREFKGQSAFSSNPKVILFKDIDVGTTYKRRVVLTNVTYTLNTCKIIDLTESLKNFVQIDFSPPGHISAGMTCEFNVTFTPQLDTDLDGEIHFLASTGPFSIPFQARTKKCIITCSAPVNEYLSNVTKASAGQAMTVDFGIMVIHGSMKRTIMLSNAGALPTDFEVKRPVSSSTPKDNATEDELEEELVEEFTLVPNDHVIWDNDGKRLLGSVPPFGSVTFEVQWAPEIPMDNCTATYVASFSHPENPQIAIHFRGNASDVPVHFRRTSVDLRICTYEKLFQDSVLLDNKGKTALRLVFMVPPALRNHLDVLPHTGYIQAESSFSAQIKLFPKLSLAKDLESTGTKYFDPLTGVLEVPITVVVADQMRSIECYVTAVITNSDLEFDLESIDFGCCSVYEAVRIPLTMRNKSMLPQDFAFLHLPEHVEVQPADGFGTILPFEELPMEVVFLPSKSGVYKFDLSCKTLSGREFKIPCSGVAGLPPLKLSEQMIHFRPTAIDDFSVAKLFVINEHVSANEFSHAVPRIGNGEVCPVGPTAFHFVVPPNVPISVSPCVGTVWPGRKETIRVRFAPTISEAEIRERAAVMATAQLNASNSQHSNRDEHGKKAGIASQRSIHPSKTSKPTTVKQVTPDKIDVGSPVYFQAKTNLLLSFPPDIKTFTIPCYVASGEALATDSLDFKEENTLYLVVHCPSVRPHLLLMSGYGSYVKDFGEIAVGQIERSHVSFQNISNTNLDMRTSALDPTGPFELRNALSSLEPGGINTGIFAFEPKEERLYQENIRIDCGLSSITMTMRGRGVKPHLAFSGLGDDRLLDLGCVISGEYTERSFTLENKSSVDIDYRIEMDPRISPTAQPVANMSGRTVFDIVPQNGLMKAGEKRTLTVNFAPDRSGSFAEKACFFLFQKPAPAYSFTVVGKSSRRMVYAYGGEQLEPEVMSLASLASSAMVQSEPDSDGQGAEEGGKKESAVALNQHSPLLVLLPLPASDESVEKSIRIGCARSVLAAKKNAEFIIENTNNLKQVGISVEPSKGSIDMGTEIAITLLWRPTADQKISTSINLNMVISAKADVSVKIPVSIRAFITAASTAEKVETTS